MSIKYASQMLREARHESGLSLEKFSEGICAVQTLSRIELGKAGAGPAIFGALMSRAGRECNMYPVFEDYEDYQCYMHLKHARFYLNAWNLKETESALTEIERSNWHNNRLYYQEWALILGKLWAYSNCNDHEYLYEIFMHGLKMTRTQIDLKDFTNMFLTVIEIELLISIAQELLLLGESKQSLSICKQIDTYMKHHHFSSGDFEKLKQEYTICYAKLLIEMKKYETAYSMIEECKEMTLRCVNQMPLIELHFLSSICLYNLGDKKQAIQRGKDSFFAAHAIHSVYSNYCRACMQNEFEEALPQEIVELEDIPYAEIRKRSIDGKCDFADGVFLNESKNTFTLGMLINRLRVEKNISAQRLYQGLCSKSTLNKIENGKMQPALALAETLLQRLGLSDREFIFFGNNEDAIYYELKMKLIRQQYLTEEQRNHYFSEYEKLDLEKNKLYKQIYLLLRAVFVRNGSESLSMYQEALRITLPEFDIYRITDYRLSWSELSIINTIAGIYRQMEQTVESIIWFRKIVEYYNEVGTDIIFQAQIFTATFAHYSWTLYHGKQFKELVESYDNMKT